MCYILILYNTTVWKQRCDYKIWKANHGASGMQGYSSRHFCFHESISMKVGLILNIWSAFNKIVYQELNKSNLWRSGTSALIALFQFLQLWAQQRVFLCCAFPRWSARHLALAWDAADGCSRLSLRVPWCCLPVIHPDRCKAALLGNMSRAGEEEVGVEAGKGQQPKMSPCVASRYHTLWHPSHFAGTLKQVVMPPPTKEQISSEIVYFYTKVEGGRVAFGSGTCCWSIRFDLISVNEKPTHPLIHLFFWNSRERVGFGSSYVPPS